MNKFRLSLFIFVLLVITKPFAVADISTSKAAGYVVVGPQPGVTTSKAAGYVVVGPQSGVTASKAAGYVVVGPQPGVTASKLIAYVVVGPPVSLKKQPSVFIMTKYFEYDPVISDFSVTKITDIQNYLNLTPW